MSKIDMQVDTGSTGIKTVGMSFPGNSHKEREKQDEPQEKRVSKVVTGKVVQQKKGFFKKMTETFVGEDIDNVGSYILYDVLIPAAKATISDMVQGGIEMLLFGERTSRKNSHVKRNGGQSYVSYNNYSNNYDTRNRQTGGMEISSRTRQLHSFEDIVLETRGEASDVLSELVDLTLQYGQATVGDLYDLVGIPSNFTDNKWGWEQLGSATVSRVRNGYALNLPRPIPLS